MGILSSSTSAATSSTTPTTPTTTMLAIMLLLRMLLMQLTVMDLVSKQLGKSHEADLGGIMIIVSLIPHPRTPLVLLVLVLLVLVLRGEQAKGLMLVLLVLLVLHEQVSLVLVLLLLLNLQLQFDFHTPHESGKLSKLDGALFGKASHDTNKELFVAHAQFLQPRQKLHLLLSLFALCLGRLVEGPWSRSKARRLGHGLEQRRWRVQFHHRWLLTQHS